VRFVNLRNLQNAPRNVEIPHAQFANFAIDVKFYRDLTHQKSLKSVNF